MATTEEVRAALRATAGGRPTKVEIDGWPELYVRQVLLDEAEEYAQVDPKEKNGKHEYARNAARVICDAAGHLHFDWRNDDDLTLLGQQPTWRLDKIWKIANEGHSGN